MSFDRPPKICCVRVRSVVIFLSIQSLIVCLWEATGNEEPVTRVTGAVAGILELILLWGVIKNVAYLLKISMYISLIHLTFDFGTILVSPVYFASQTASGYDSNDTYPILPIILGAKSEEEDRFILGLLTGYSVEIISTFSVFLSILQFVLINRCYTHAKRWEEAMFQMHNKPTVCCLQARSVIIVFSVTGLFVCTYQTITGEEDRVSQVTGAFCSVSEVILLYGVVKHVSHLLRISMFISLIHVTLDFGTILVSPVYFASQTASGYVSNDTYPVFQIIMTPDIEKEDRFVAGLVTGYSVTVISTLLVFLSILEFVLINRCYVYTKMMEDAVFKRNNVMKF